ncbi:hypothetical protein TruAng_010887 [Truncatella angustata]|nr:hypothetical protein TruAng_010887 [Truncatella angustata]
MFFKGTLQEGISTALQQSKQVICFVTDGSDESEQWETEFLAEDRVKGPLETQAVTLRLQAGSEEAGYLEALFPVPRKPTVVVIQAGQLKEYIAAGTSKDEFLRRLSLALEGPSHQAPASASSATPAHTSQESAPAPAQLPQSADEDVYGNSAPSTLSAPPTEEPPQASPHIQALLAERAARLEANKTAKEAAAKAEAKKRAEEQAAAGTSSSEGQQQRSVDAAEKKHADLLRKRRQDEKAERQRILRRIEDDRRERREREAQERQARLLLTAATTGNEVVGAGRAGSSSAPPQRSDAVQLPSRGGGAHCNLQVRLLDGSTIRSRFPSDAKLGGEVRGWIDENRTDGDEPYTFRVVLTPLPNKTVEASEEADSLLDLGLAPSATLVLVPRVRVANAFEQTGGALYRALAGVWALLAMVLNFPFTLVGGGGARSSRAGQAGEEIPMENLDGEGSARREGQDQRVRGFQNPDDRRRDQQLYNGNSLNFEPRNDDDDQHDTQ